MNLSFLMITSVIGSIVVALGLLLIYFFVRSSIALYIRSVISGARRNVGLFKIAQLRILQKVPDEKIAQIVQAIIMAQKAGVVIDSLALEAHSRSGGNIEKVVQAMIAAHKAGFLLTFQQAKEIDLAKNRDVLEAVRMRIKPIVCDMPTITAQAMDGIELKIHCRVTLRANLEFYLKGADQATILAKVGDGIVSAVGKAVNHQDIIANPFTISEQIIERDVDDDNIPDVYQGSGFEVLSIDVADVDVGRNIKAKLDGDLADADLKTAKSEAEKRRTEATERVIQMKVRITEMRAAIKRAEAEIPLAIAQALTGEEVILPEQVIQENALKDG